MKDNHTSPMNDDQKVLPNEDSCCVCAIGVKGVILVDDM